MRFQSRQVARFKKILCNKETIENPRTLKKRSGVILFERVTLMLCGGWAGTGVPWSQMPTWKVVIGGDMGAG